MMIDAYCALFDDLMSCERNRSRLQQKINL